MLTLLPAVAAAGAGGTPAVIAHRGASGYLPEHTLEAYARAIDMGADFIEPDLVFTKDGVLVARHNRWLSLSTDVADRPEFADRRVIKPGKAEPDWYAEDFTFAELRTLRARQAFPGRSKTDDGTFLIPRLEEILELARDARVGVYPEAKAPAALAALGHDFAEPLLDALGRYGFGPGGLPVFIQSFDPGFLRSLRNRTRIPLMMLVYGVAGSESVSLDQAAEFADGVAPAKALLIDPQGADTGYVRRAHELGLLVHPYTFRDDLVGTGFADIDAELRAFLALGIDGLFTDFPDTAVAVRGAR
ncbi:glycerophosphodiester phosphodiesterase family protein [Emcibacter sp. SYSU 3D8]|uniref:glycerophosphodiester phosphodiesterase family protein n=1 Tax=Emcibacter sp. SYSU 3D8 TaxID=3133969 RepID=UPI0031FF45B0